MTKVFQHFYEAQLPPQQSFSRASTATYVNAQGEIATAAINTPRFEPGKGLLLEPAESQYVGYPTNLGGSTWLNQGVTIAPPGGTLWGLFTPVEIRSGGLSGHRREAIGISVAAGQVVPFSMIYAAGGQSPSNRVLIRFFDATNSTNAFIRGPAAAPAYVESGAGAVSALTTTVLADGVYLTQGLITVADTSTDFRIGIGPDSNAVGASTLAYGANLTNGAVPSSFILTASRAADVLSDVVFPSALTQGTLVAGLRLPSGGAPSGTNALMTLTNTSGDTASIDHLGSSNDFRARSTDNGALQSDFVHPFTSQRFVAALRFADNDFAASFDGEPAATDSSGAASTLDALQVPTPTTPTYLDHVAVYDDALSNGELVLRSARGIFQRDMLDLTIQSNAVGISAIHAALLAGVRELAPYAYLLQASASAFLAKPATLMRRVMPSSRLGPFKPKP